MWTVAIVVTLIICVLVKAGLKYKIRFSLFFDRLSYQKGPCPTYSIVLLLKDNERDIEWLVRRIMMLKYGNCESFEILLVDCGSKDMTPDIARILSFTYLAVKYIVHRKGLLAFYNDVKKYTSGRVIFLEKISDSASCSLVFRRIRRLLRKKCTRRSWDRSPMKNKTIEEYNKDRHDDTI